MSDTIQLTSERGTLRISHDISELHKVLSFKHVFTEDVGSYKVKDKVTGKERLVKRKGKITSQTEDLFSIGEDGSMFTHDGCLHMVVTALNKIGLPYEYERLDPQWPIPVLTKSVIRGLYPEQIEGVIKLLASTGGALLQAGTSAGKTRIIAALIRAFPSENIVVMTYRSAVVRGLHKNLNELLAEDGIQVGICQGPNVDIRRVTVGTIGSFHHLDPSRARVLIADEVHRFASNTAAEVALSFSSAKKIGLSATLERFDGKRKLLEGIFGHLVYTLSDQELEDAGRCPPLDCYFLSVSTGPAVDNLTPVKAKKVGIWNNDIRNGLIRQVADLVPPDQQMLVFCETVEHLESLLKILPEFEFCHGKMTTAQRKVIEDRFTSGAAKRIISTDVMSEGIDPAHLYVMVDATAVKGDAAMVQKRGRLRRPGKERGVLVSFMDEYSSIFYAKALKRIKEHEDRGDTVTEMAQPSDIQFVNLK